MKIVITGGTGLLASNFCYLLKDKHEVICVSRKARPYLSGVEYRTLDLADLIHVQRFLEEVKPDLVINTAGLTSVESCEESYYKAYTSNVLPAKNLAKATSEYGHKLVHISTDHFSDSKTFLASEDEIEAPRNVYAATKLEAEREVGKNDPKALILRTNFFGWGHRDRKSFSDYLIEKFEKGEEIKAFEDVLYNPILVDDLLNELMILTSKGASGVFNVCSERPLSKYHFALDLAKTFGFNKNLVKADSLAGRSELVARPLDMSISRRKLDEYCGGSEKRNLSQMLTALKESRQRREVFESSYNELDTYINYGKQWITDEDLDRVTNVICNKALTQGDEIDIFEEELKRVTGAKYAIAVCNWTAGLHISCMALGVGPGDKVVTSPNSFVASANCVEYVGGEVIFCDIDPETLNLCPKDLERICKENKVKVVIPVHFAGCPCDMESISALSKKYDFSILEDAAHALGGKYQCGSPIGSCKYADIVGFSFHPVKNIACGEGGAILTNSSSIYQKLLRYRSHGIAKSDADLVNKELAYTDGKRNPWYYELLELGYNYRITDMQSALGTSQIQKLSMFLKRRIDICHQYDKALGDVPHVKLLQSQTRNISGNHLYSIAVDYEALKVSRYRFHERMREKGVSLHVHYIPIFMQPYYAQKCADQVPMLSNTQEFYRRATTLPLYPKLTDGEVEHIIKSFISTVDECIKGSL